MNILFIENNNHIFQTPLSGASVRSSLLISALARIGSVDIVSFACRDEISSIDNSRVIYSSVFSSVGEYEGRIQKFKRLLTPWILDTIFPPNDIKCKVIDEIIGKTRYDFIVTRYLQTVGECNLLKYADRLILDVDDNPKSFYTSQARLAKTKRNKLYGLLFAQTIDFAVKYVARKIHVMFHSNNEQIPSRLSVYLPNTVNVKQHITLCDYSQTPNNILFVGFLGYYPNYLGVDYFLEKIFPTIKKHIPDVTISIVGKDLPKDYLNKWRGIDGVLLKGYVFDLAQEYTNCRLVVLPIYHGAGTAIKFLESISYLRPCVSSPYGVRGHKNIFVDKTDYLIATGPDSFAEKAVELLSSEALNHSICKNAYAKFLKNYSLDAFNQIVRNSIFA